MPGDGQVAGTGRFDPAKAVRDDGVSEALHHVLEADARIEQKYNQLGGEAHFGRPATKDTGTMWETTNGSVIVHNDDKQAAFEVHGLIAGKWRELGGLTWGIPCTDQTNTPDGVGQYNHFNNDTASIYWTEQTGAHSVYGEIRKRDVVVQFTGMHCFGETDSDQLSTGDEPYAIVGVTTPQVASTTRTRVYGGIDAGESCPDLVEVYRGRPYGINIASVVMEHDFGDPDKYKDEVQKAVAEAHEFGKQALGYIPAVGPLLAAAAGKFLDKYVPAVGAEVNNWLDSGDDRVGTSTLTLSARDMVLTAARTGNSEFDGIGFKAETDLISGLGASYKCYYGLVPA